MTKKTSKIAKNIILVIIAVYMLIPFFSYVFYTYGALKTIRQTTNIEDALHHLGSYSAIGNYIDEWFQQSNYNIDSWMCRQINSFIKETNITFATEGSWIVQYIAYVVDGFIMYVLFYTLTIVPSLIGGLLEHET